MTERRGNKGTPPPALRPRRMRQLNRVGHASGIPLRHARIRNKAPSSSRPIPNARDTSQTNRVSVDLPEPFGPRVHSESRHAALGGLRRQLADDLEILSGWGARHPFDLELSAIAALHHIETIGVEIEDRKPGGKSVLKRLTARRTRCVVELRAVEVNCGGHTLLCQPAGMDLLLARPFLRSDA